MDITAGAPAPHLPSAASPRAGWWVAWTLRDVVIGLVLLVGILVVVPIPIVVVTVLLTDQHSQAFLVVEVLVGAPLYALIAGVAARQTFVKYGGGVERLGVRVPRWSTLGWAGAALVAALAVGIAYGSIVELFDLDFLKQGCADQVPTDIRAHAYILALASFCAVVFAPAAEELFFRGFVFPGLARAWGIPAGIVVSGLLFGSAHLLGNPYLYKSLVQFAAIGMIFAFVYWKSGNLFAPLLAHVCFNLLGVITLAATTCNE
jgi:membrane protease YdiL (CAAX protease family)